MSTVADKLLAAHAQGINDYANFHAESIKETTTKGRRQSLAGKKVGARARIEDAELQMYNLGIEYTPWVAPRAVRSSNTGISVDEMRDNLALAVFNETDKTAPETVRARAVTRVDAIVRAAVTRAENGEGAFQSIADLATEGDTVHFDRSLKDEVKTLAARGKVVQNERRAAFVAQSQS